LKDPGRNAGVFFICKLGACYYRVMTPKTVRPWPAFALLSSAFFMVVLDFSIVSIALPEMQSGLHMSPAEAQWILSVYMLVFAGFLMLCGGLADIFGRRRFFLAGIVVFGLGSLAAGFSNDGTTLILLRAIQGLGAAMCNPSGLAIATTLFPSGPQRNRAVGLWAAVGSGGVLFGMILGGILVAAFDWRAVLWVNVPVCLALLILTPIFVPRDVARTDKSKLDIGGAILLTATLLLLTYTIVRIPDDGFSTISFMRATIVVVLFLGFLAVESRVAQPLVPARLFRYQDFGGGMLLALVQAAAYASIYWQSVAALPPLLTGLAFLPSALLMTVAVGPTASGLAQRFGARALSTIGSVIMIASMGLAIYLTALDPQWWFMLVVTIIGSVGCMETFELSMIAGLAHVAEADEGIASGAISTGSQIGMGLGVAVAAAFAVGREPAEGVHLAFWSPLGFSVATLLVSFFLITGKVARVQKAGRS
jgi:MFS family permease